MAQLELMGAAAPPHRINGRVGAATILCLKSRGRRSGCAWFLVLGAWCLVLGAWCLVLGAWCLVLGSCARSGKRFPAVPLLAYSAAAVNKNRAGDLANGASAIPNAITYYLFAAQ